jgi:superfamily II DNA or RNA helicase
MTDADTRRARIEQERARIAELERELRLARVRLRHVESEPLTVAEAAPDRVLAARGEPGGRAPTAAEKVALFRSLFRGREDVFPKLWVNRSTGRKGYAPACGNEWKPGLCEKPRVRCGECPHQAFLPVTDREILGHLQGRHVLGVYPLLRDETCWLVAADFDEASWADDVSAFRATCASLGLPVAVERSRSGNGAHAWLFFAEPVPAAAARKLACFVLTETMSRRHALSMESYDRLFPNQDTMPKGGFGNLIALPLQHEPRKAGNTLFLDDDLTVVPDQWAYLHGLARIDRTTVESVADDASRRGAVLGVRHGQEDDEASDRPWERPARSPARSRIAGPLPDGVLAVVSNRVYVETDGLASALLAQVKRLAAFQNPEFYRKQAMRFSTALTPRVISCAEELPRHLALPRGCLDDLRHLLADNGVALQVRDEREGGAPLDVAFVGELTAPQGASVAAMLAHDCGLLSAPPGAGKTVMGAALVAARGRSTLVLVHRKPLLEQWAARLASFLQLPPDGIGMIGGGHRKVTGTLDVAMIQSLVRRDVVDDLVGRYGHVVVDECHHVAAVSFERALAAVRARYVTGLTATPYRRDGHQAIILMQCGPIRHSMRARGADAGPSLRRVLILRDTDLECDAACVELGIQAVYAALASDRARNELIAADVLAALDEGRSPIVLTERRDHLERFVASLAPRCRNLVALHGGLKPRARREALAALAAVPDSEPRLLVATGRYVGEGFDDARLDTLFLASPVSWKGTLVQYAGRLDRTHASKAEVRVHDYRDARVPVLARMCDRRLRRFRALGYEQETAPIGGGA